MVTQDDSSRSQYPVSLSQPEQWLISTLHALGTPGVLVLRSLAYLTGKEGPDVQISRETLARHSGRSIRTVSRAVARLKALHLAEAEQPAPKSFDYWEPNVYRLTPLGLHLAGLLGTGGNSPEKSARDTDGSLVCEEKCSETSLEKTSETLMAHAENTALFQEQTPAPSLGPELEPPVQALEERDPQRFASLREWVRAKLRVGVPCRHLAEALASLAANRDRVQAPYGWIQDRLEDVARADRAAEQARARAAREAQAWREQVQRWEQERAEGAIDLTGLVMQERKKTHNNAQRSTFH